MKLALKRILASPAFIAVFAFSVRMCWVYVGWSHARTPVRADVPYGYEAGLVARAIAAGEGFSSPLRVARTGATAWLGPIYPYLLAAIFKIWGTFSVGSHIVIEVLNCAFASLTVIPIYCVAKRTFGEGVAVGAAWVWVFLPTALFFPIAWVWDTTLTALLFTLIFWATLAVRERRDVLAWIGYGALWAIAVSTNPSVLSLFPFFLGWLVWHLRKESTRWVAPAAAALLIFCLGLTPWTVRNYRVFHKVIVLRSNFGLELWLGNNPDVATDWTPWRHPNDDPAEGAKYTSMGEIAYMAQKQHEAFQFMRTHPLDTVQFMFHRFVNNWLATSDSPVDSLSGQSLSIKAFFILNCLLSLGCLLGTLLAYRTQNLDVFPYAMTLLIFPLVFYLTHASLRYRFPIDPIMVVLATYGLSRLPLLVWLRGSHQLRHPHEAQSLPGD